MAVAAVDLAMEQMAMALATVQRRQPIVAQEAAHLAQHLEMVALVCASWSGCHELRNR
jgi:hypothetical protein